MDKNLADLSATCKNFYLITSNFYNKVTYIEGDIAQ